MCWPGAQHDGAGGYLLTFSGYVRDDGVTAAFADASPVLALSFTGGETLTASYGGDGYARRAARAHAVQAEAVGSWRATAPEPP